MSKFAHTLVSLVVLLIGLAICGYGICKSIGTVSMLVRGEQTEALVIESVKEVKRSGGGRRFRRGTYTQYSITVSYTDTQGVEHTTKSTISGDSRLFEGDRVPICYLPDAPDKVMVSAWTSMTAPTVIPLMVGLAFLGGGVAMLRENRRKHGEDKGMGDAR